MDELDEAMERLIDDYGLLAVMMSAAVICRLKAAHIRSNWQDMELAARWTKAAKKIEGMQKVLKVPSPVASPATVHERDKGAAGGGDGPANVMPEVPCEKPTMSTVPAEDPHLG